MNEERPIAPAGEEGTHMRAEEWQRALDVLKSAPIAYVAPAGEEPYVLPLCFAYEAPAQGEDSGRVIFHTGEGRKTRALSADGRVCLAVVMDAVFDRGPEPCRDGYAFRSVLVEGTASLLLDDEARERALRTLVDKYDPEAREQPFAEKDLRATLVYSVAVSSLSYKEQRLRG